MFDTQTLDNGLRAVITPIAHTRAVTIQLAVGIGFGYESERTHGLAHFVEHMLFKGTGTRPTFSDITGFIESLGGSINAATDKEMTFFFVRCPSAHFEPALEILADIVHDSTFDPEEVERERRVLIDEAMMSRDTPDDWAMELLEQLLWPGHGLGRPISDNLEVTRNATPDVLRDYAARYFGAANAVISVAGNVERERAVESIEARFHGYRSGERAEWPEAGTLNGCPDSRLAIEERDGLQVSVALGTRSLSQTDPDRYPLELLNAILGEGMCSRLFAEIRERQALTYDVSSYTSQNREGGSIAIFANSNPDDTGAMTSAIIEECELLKTQSPSGWELERAREYVKGGLILGMEESHNVASWYAREELLEQERMTVDAVIQRLDAVTAGDISRVAQRIFAGDWVRLAAVGPVKDRKSLAQLIGSQSTSFEYVS